MKYRVSHRISLKFSNLYPDTRSEQECTFLSFAANEASITAHTPIGALKSDYFNQISQKILNLYSDSRSEKEGTFLSFPANEDSITAIQ